MNILMTGAGGTVGSALSARARQQHHTTTAWDRNLAPPDDAAAVAGFIHRINPDAIIHLAIPSRNTGRENEGHLVNVEWSGLLARQCRDRGIPFIYTSTAMVFTDRAKGPFYPDTSPDATEGYGGEKRRGEERVFAENPSSIVVRLGWQIGSMPGSNNMVDFFAANMRDKGVIPASRRWLPACSFVEDTADLLLQLLDRGENGIFHSSSNDQWNFFEIATALNRRHGDLWNIQANDDFVYDQRMPDPRIQMPPLADRLPELRELP